MQKLKKFILLTSLIFFVLLYSFSTSSAIQNKPRVAILSFDNLSKALNDPQLETLTGGMCESLIAGMSNIGSIILVERGQINKVLQEQALGLSGAIDESTAPKVGKLLGANTVVLGSFQVIGGQIRITARFVDTETGVIDQSKVQMVTGRWTDDVFTLQDQLSIKFCQSFGITPTSGEQSRMTTIFKSTNSYTAYDYYIKGRDYLLLRTFEDTERAIEQFQKALEVDRNYALAYAGLASAYNWLGVFRGSFITLDEKTYRYYEKGKEYADKALSLNRELPEAWIQRGRARSDEPLSAWANDIQEAIKLNPNSAEAYFMLVHWYVIFKDCNIGKNDQKWLDKGFALDPNCVDHMTRNNLAYFYIICKRDYQSAKPLMEAAVKSAPNNYLYQGGMGDIYCALGEMDLAIESYKKAIELNTWVEAKLLKEGCHAGLGGIYCYQGNIEMAKAEMEKIKSINPKSKGINFVNACLYIKEDKIEEALKEIKNTIEKITPELLKKERKAYIEAHPIFSETKDDPRFRKLVK